MRFESLYSTGLITCNVGAWSFRAFGTQFRFRVYSLLRSACPGSTKAGLLEKGDITRAETIAGEKWQLPSCTKHEVV